MAREPQSTPAIVIIDQPLFAEGLATSLRQQGLLDVTSTSKTSYLTAKPDSLVLIELFLPNNQCGLQLTHQIQHVRPDLLPIVWTMHPKPLHAWIAMEYNVPGFLDKSISRADLLYWLKHAFTIGTAWLGTLLEQARQWGHKIQHFKSLSADLWCLWLELLRGRSVNELMARIGWSKRTIERRISELYTALGVQSRAEVVTLAWCCDLVELRNGEIHWCAIAADFFSEASRPSFSPPIAAFSNSLYSREENG